MKYKFGTWNIGGLAGSVPDAEPKTYEVLNILVGYGINLAILTEMKHRGASYEKEYEVSGMEYNLFFAGPENGKRIIMELPWPLKLHFRQFFSNRIITGWLKNGRETIQVVGAYAPTEDSDECVKDDFYDGLQHVLSRANVNQKVILLRDFNANINPMDGASDGAIVGPYDCWKRLTNENGFSYSICFRVTYHMINCLDV